MNFVREKLTQNELNESNLTDMVFKVAKGQTCFIANDLMLDGLSYTLYKLNDEKYEFIKIHNGLDGSIKTYGGFVR